jgi:hypothetical protein
MMNNTEMETPTVYIASNPLALINVFIGILTGLTGVLTRLIGAADQNKEMSAADVNDIHTFCHLAGFSQELQHKHWLLLAKSGMSKKFVNPLGSETFGWSSSQQADEYKNIRDQTLDAFIRVTAQSIQFTRFYISQECEEKIHEALDRIQDCLYQAIHLETFEDGCAALAEGFKIATATFEEIVNEISPPGPEMQSKT